MGFLLAFEFLIVALLTLMVVHASKLEELLIGNSSTLIARVIS